MRDLPSGPDHTPRQRWMGVLARASAAEIEGAIAGQGRLPEHTVLKPAAVGTVMVEGRAGGSGTRFNLGEATVARCIVRLADGTLGAAFALGSDRRKAHLAAIADALLQRADAGGDLHRAIDALAAAQARRRQDASRKAAATKVEFFTLSRGDG